MHPIKVGILGGGQLGRMMAEAASPLGIEISVLDPSGPSCSSGHCLPNQRVIHGKFDDLEKVCELIKSCDYLSYEIEHIDCDILEKAVSIVGKQVDAASSEHSIGLPKIEPRISTLKLIQDKYLQKKFLKSRDIKMPNFQAVDSIDELKECLRLWEHECPGSGYPAMLKTRRLAYDGKGNAKISSENDVESAWNSLTGGSKHQEGTLYVEQWVRFSSELAVMVAKSNSEIKCYPVVRTIQRDSICELVLAPAQIPDSLAEEAEKLSMKVVSQLDGSGIYGIEMFEQIDESGKRSFIFNEVAPRPHNSGHYTIECCECSQFEQHIRAVVGLPLGSTSMIHPYGLMINALGREDANRSSVLIDRSYWVNGCHGHWYGKQGSRPGRKLGHVTLTAASIDSLYLKASAVLAMGGNYLEKCKKLTENHELSYGDLWQPDQKDRDLMSQLDQVLSRNRSVLTTGNGYSVGIVMGSDSDLKVMKLAAEILEDLAVEYELTIVSAHRTPERLYEYAKSARRRGIKVIIAGAGGAAHLPGMLASMTCVPVIGVPVSLKNLDGMDSLLSIVQMPRGIPVACVAIDNAQNAGLLAARMMGIGNESQNTLMKSPSLWDRLEQYAAQLRGKVEEKYEKLERIGWKQYLSR